MCHCVTFRQKLQKAVAKAYQLGLLIFKMADDCYLDFLNPEIVLTSGVKKAKMNHFANINQNR